MEKGYKRFKTVENLPFVRGSNMIRYGPRNWVPYYVQKRTEEDKEHRKESCCKEKGQSYRPTTKRVIKRITTIVEEIHEVES